MANVDQIKAIIDANVYENHNNEVTANGVKAAMYALAENSGSTLTGFVSVDSIAELPDPGQPTLGYLVGENLYLYVGTGGDTLGGKYADCGPFRGPAGAPGTSGADGKSAYQIWLDDGHAGSEEDFLASLQGNTGSSVDYPFTLVNNLTEGGVDKALTAEQGKVLNGRFDSYFGAQPVDTPMDLNAYPTSNFNLENASAWAANSTYKCIIIPATDFADADKLVFEPLTFKCSFAFLKSNNAANGVAPDLCAGESVTTLAVGTPAVVKDIPADCNYLYVYKSNQSTFTGKLSVSKRVEGQGLSLALLRSDIVDSLDSDASDEPLSAKQGKVLYEILDHSAGTETTELSNDNATSADIHTYLTPQNKSRGYMWLPLPDGCEVYGAEMTIAAGSPIKAGIGLSPGTPGQVNYVYDSGWQTAGTLVVTQALGDPTVKYVVFPFTYIATDNGVPTLVEINQYITFRLYYVNEIPGGLLQDVADLQALPRDPFAMLKQSQDVYAVGASTSRKLACLTIYDLKQERNMMDLQSVVVDRANKRLILNRAATTSRVLGFATDEFTWGDLSVGNIGHGNDACMVGSDMWVSGGNALDSSDIKRLYKSDLAGSSTYVDLAIPDNPGGGTQRVIGGVSRFMDDDTLLVATFDYRGNTNNAGDLLVVYTYKISTGVLTEVFSTQWSGWFIQGATYIGGYLYIATNMTPSGSTYTGIRVWKIDAMDWTLCDPMEFSGRYEPEGIDSMWDNVTPVLYMGMASYQLSPNECKILKLEAF